MENANFKKFRLLTGVVSFLLALAVFSTVVGAVPNPSYSEYADNSTVLDEDDLEEIQDIIDEDALEDIIENRKLGSIVDKDELEKVVDKEKVASELKEARLSEILDLRDLIYLIKDQKIKWLVEGDEFDDFGELFEGEDFRKIGETIDLNRFTDEELGGFIKDDKVEDLLAHLTFDDLQESLGHRPIEYSDLKRILDDERLADMIERDDVEDVLKILSDEKLKNVIHEDEIDNIGDIIDEGDLDELLENEDIAEALDDNDFGSELSDSELYSILKDQKIGKIRAIIDEDDAVQFIDFEEILNFAEGSDFLQIYQIIRDEYIGDVVQVSDREDLGGIISDKDLGEILKERGFALGYDRDERINLDMRDVITDRGLSEMFEEKSLSEIEHILQNEDADDLRRLLTESKIDDSVDEEALLDFIENRDLFSVLSIIGEEDLDSVLKNDVTDKDLAKIIRKDDLEEVVSDRELGSLIKDESLGEFEDVLDDAALGRAIEDVGLANLIDDKELGGFLRDKNINDLVDDSYQDRRRYRDDYDYGDGDRNYYYGDRDSDYYYGDRDRNYYYGDRDRYYYDDDRYRRDYDTNRRCSGRSIYRLQDSRRSFQSYRNRTFLREDYNPFIHGGHRNHMGREDSYYDYYNYRYDYMNSRYGSRSYRYGCRGEIGREDLTIREALGRGESRGDSGADANGDSDDAELQDIMITKVINPKIVSSGNEFLIGVRVSNRDSRSKNVDVTVDIDGERQGSKNVNIPADGRRFMNFDSEYSGPSDNVEVNITAESGDQKDKFLMDMDIATINAFIQASPETMQAGENTLISGGVEESTHASGIETRANLYVDGVRRGNVDTDTNGKFSRHLKLEDAGVHEIKVQNSDFSVSQLVNVTPVIDVENLQMPEKIFAGKEFTVCGDVIGKGIDSVEAALFVDSNISIRRTVDTSNGKIRTCFDTVFKEAEDKNIAIKAGLDKPKNGVERDIEVRHSINISSKEETVVETGNWSDLKANISNLLSRERDIKVFLVDLEEGKAKDFVKNITLDGNSMEPVVFEIKTEEVGEYSVRVEASSEGYTRSEVVRIRAETSSTITSRTVKWLEKRTGSKISSQNAIEGTQNLGLYIYNWIRNHPTLVLALLAILLLAGLLKKTRDVLVEPDTLDPYRY